ncbi:lecithin-cholesterol acyltransferase-related [Anaeramoeba ignava]|uniref:Lecithin-cholesterol acyltransferase-related n=1 Tax=Anaeramoeba ignava TaxID=1746090 RepID=A0A9Q0LAB0_ANAIG|nr:lecithin-cholesterol acyltransferase-related [Anaeramoeba ignava]|eukprot:Anaeramoba_ignava/a607534_255.p1 GENE.a607534_255~~a607534_255.p1  ORF type:complete len:413 (-),score=123.43 a607534_255:50-1261(-)
MKVFFIFFILILILTQTQEQVQEHLDPVVIIPGLGGTKLDIKLDNAKSDYWWCRTNADWYRIWVSASEMLPEVVDCFAERLSIVYDEQTNTWSDPEGVAVKTQNGLEAISNLDPELIFMGYFKDMINKFKDHGYQEGLSIFGLPYDWRWAPGLGLTEFVQNIKTTIEYAYNLNGGKKVTVVTHSMGCCLFLDLLNSVDDAWKEQYIKGWMAISPPWGGVGQAVVALLIGYTFGIPDLLLSAKECQILERTLPAIYFFLPKQVVYGDSPIVQTPTKTYTSSMTDLHQLLNDLNLPENTHSILDLVAGASEVVSAPNVQTHIFYGTSKKTPVGVVYHDKLGGDDYSIIEVDGDNTCASSIVRKIATLWSTQQQQAITTSTFDCEHQWSPSDESVVNGVLDFVLNN